MTTLKKSFYGSVVVTFLFASMVWGYGVFSGDISPWMLLWLPVAVIFNSFFIALIITGVLAIGSRVENSLKINKKQ